MDSRRAAEGEMVLQLRAKAEAALGRDPPSATPGRTAEELLYELRVHQVELEMQNEALRRAHLAMEESRDRYVELYEFAPVGYISLTEKGLIVAANHAAATLLGRERNKLLGGSFDACILRADDRARWQRLFAAMMLGAVDTAIELGLAHGDHGVVHVRIDCRSGALGGVMPVLHVTLADISARRRAEFETSRQLRRSEALLRHAHDCIFMLDADTRIVAVSDSCKKAYGYSRGEFLSMTAADLLVAEVRAEAPNLRSLTPPGSLSYRTWHCRKDGSRFPVEVGATMIELDGERCYQAIVRDISAVVGKR